MAMADRCPDGIQFPECCSGHRSNGFQAAHHRRHPRLRSHSPRTTASGTVRIRNAGAAALALGTIDFSGVAAPFAVTADPCSNTVLNPDQACTLSISFAPTVLGEFSGSFAIPSNDPDQPQVTVALSGFGNTPPLAPQPQSPANGATVGDPVTFTWLPASDADGDAVTQALVVSPHPDFSVADTIPVDSVPPVTPLALGAGGLLLGVLGLTLAQGRRRWVLLLMAGGLLLAPVACGGGGGGGTPPPNPSPQPCPDLPPGSPITGR